MCFFNPYVHEAFLYPSDGALGVQNEPCIMSSKIQALLRPLNFAC